MVVGCGVGVLCENWIVDASNLFFFVFCLVYSCSVAHIALLCVVGFCVAFLLLFVVGAHGGCLGTLRR